MLLEHHPLRLHPDVVARTHPLDAFPLSDRASFFEGLSQEWKHLRIVLDRIV